MALLPGVTHKNTVRQRQIQERKDTENQKLTMDHACDIFLENPGYKDPYGTAPG